MRRMYKNALAETIAAHTMILVYKYVEMQSVAEMMLRPVWINIDGGICVLNVICMCDCMIYTLYANIICILFDVCLL